MENEEKEDLLLEVTESEDDIYEKEDRDCYIEEKILDFIHKEKQNHKSTKKTLAFITACLFMFLSSSVLIITLPIYLQYSTRSGIPTYSKLVTLSAVNAGLFGVVQLGTLLARWAMRKPENRRLCLPNVVKISLPFSIGSIIIFWLTDGNYISCHLMDPLKGCAVVFSLLFYFVLSRKRMSVERIFCAVTVIVGVFVTIDFGICDKFRCNGSTFSSGDGTHRLHFLYVVFYIIAHGIWVLHYSYIEICWTGFQCSNSNLSLSVLSNVSKNTVCDYDKQPCQSLSVICHEGGGKNNPSSQNPKKSFLPSKLCASNRILKCRRANSENSLNNSVPCTNQLSVPTFKDFPITSTPVHEKDGILQSWTSHNSFDVLFWQHFVCCIVVLSLCWLPTVSFLHNGKSKLLVEVVHEVCQSFSCHSGSTENPECGYLFVVTITMVLSYVVFMVSSLEVLKVAESAVTVVSIMMLALPMSSLWWSLYRLNRSSSNDVLEFNPEITGEAVCAMLGFPIIGIGSLLLLKSHIREFKLLIVPLGVAFIYIPLVCRSRKRKTCFTKYPPDEVPVGSSSSAHRSSDLVHSISEIHSHTHFLKLYNKTYINITNMRLTA